MDRISFGSRSLYQPPLWLTASTIMPELIPRERVQLGRFPTPVHAFSIPGTEHLDLDFYIKRDDLSSFDLSGNKVRKLEFLLAEATNHDCDCVITVGGVQSNHCRATAVAARQLGLDPFLILRKPLNKDASEPEPDLGLTGNLLFDRLVGADVRLVSPSAYAMIGSDALCAQLEGQLRAEGRRPYVIPVGGSNKLGAFGYLQFVQELLETGGEEGGEGAVAPGAPYDHIVFGCGSGGTAAGIAIGVLLSPLHGRTMVHAVGVCDSPDVFYEHVRDVAVELGLDPALLGDVRSWLKVYEGQGVGYAK
ncbi:tryptophan synthase beta subunit-like PLP-dependent enzyme [Ochromonadaceae sp. CCMP2298]|nr:tryptophan synthase beta subunit-like PLP-dependent enzyme [Ochromonadaceae sp. CCMP2298]